MQTDNDEDGEIISINGAATGGITDADDAGNNDAKADRGDDFTPTDDDDDNEGGPEEGRDAPPTEPAKPNAKPNAIPKARFDEVNEDRKATKAALDAANAEIARLLAHGKPDTQARPTFDEDAKEKEYIEAMMNGETDAALAIRREINANIREQSRHDAAQDIEYRTAANNLADESTKAVEDYPYLETDEGAYALGLIIAARDVDIGKGVPPHLALRRAVAAIAPRFMPDENETPSRDLPNDKPALDTRTQRALSRGARDSNLQPPALQAGIGTRVTGGRVDWEKIDEDQFRSMTLAEKKRARGD